MPYRYPQDGDQIETSAACSSLVGLKTDALIEIKKDMQTFWTLQTTCLSYTFVTAPKSCY